MAAQVGIRPEWQVQRRLPGGWGGWAYFTPHREVARAGSPNTILPAAERGRGDARVNHPGWLGVGHPVQVGHAGDLARPSAHNVELGRRHLDRRARGHAAHEPAWPGHFSGK